MSSLSKKQLKVIATSRSSVILVVGVGIFLTLAFFSYSLNPAYAEGYFSFDEQTKKLTVSTPMLELKIEGGAIVYLKDNRTGEIFVDTTAWGNLFDYWDYPNGTKSSFISRNVSTGNMNSERVQKSSPVVFSQLSLTKASLTYSKLLADGSGNSRFIIEITIDEAKGEVSFQLTGLDGDLNWQPSQIYLPILNFSKNSVILGSGAKIARTDSPVSLETNMHGFGLPSPSVGIIEGGGSVLMAWSETASNKYIQGDSIQLNHKAEYDSLVFYCGTDPKEQNKQIINSPVYRIGFYNNWLEAARYWRQRFEQRTNAKPLWENIVPWVRDIHVVHTGFYWDWELDKYDQLAKVIPPKNLLWFLWNGDRIVLAGDHTYLNIRLPLQNWTDIMRSKGWHILLYHFWNLYWTEQGAADRLQDLANKGWLPANYKFNPDYVGADVPGYDTKTGKERYHDWSSYWQDISDAYGDGSTLRVMIPQTNKFQDYLVRNFGHWCANYNNQCDGSYFDILGSFNRTAKIIDGKDYVMGEISALERVHSELPNLAVMSEYIPESIIPHVFYTWQGSTYIDQYQYTHSPLNHPLRTALIGSYVWSREETSTKPDESALVGALPSVNLVGDYGVSDEIAIWSQARAKLFVEAELWNDLPGQWDPESLAYYRSKYGTWFKAKKIGENDFGYYEEIPGMGDVLRLQKSNPVILPRPNFKKGDLNDDGVVNLTDFAIIKSDFLRLAANLANLKSDIDGDGQVTIKDVGIMMSSWE